MPDRTEGGLGVSGAPLRNQILECLYWHRLLATRHIAALYYGYDETAPVSQRDRMRALRPAQQLLNRLRKARLVDKVQTSPKIPPPGSEAVYFLTQEGTAVVEAALDELGHRYPRAVTPEMARGPMQTHNLEVADVGVAFAREARRRGDAFGPLGWRRDVLHRISDEAAGPRSAVIADAVLRYLHHAPDGPVQITRFVELDRATMDLQRLLDKIRNYASLHGYRRKGETGPAWTRTYTSFPKLLVVLSGGTNRNRKDSRREALLRMAAGEPALAAPGPPLDVSVTSLDALMVQGPFAPIWWTPHQPDGPPVTILGRPHARGSDTG
ncbi:MAG: replication-relaxation family protein [Acidimicrobiia bacterium]|nr:replication-relaxation family protein [Acidimicrobiia bacterium]